MRNTVIRLRHGEAQAFFSMMSHPDPAILQARDMFFQSLSENTPIRRDGTSLVMDIPDDGDFTSLFSNSHTAKPSPSSFNESVYQRLIDDIKITAYDPGGDYSFSSILPSQDHGYTLPHTIYNRFDGIYTDAA